MKDFKIKPLITNTDDDSLSIYFKDISKYKSLTTDEESELVNKIKNGDKQAFDKLICSNLKFVISVAKQYQGQGLDLVDLINEGNIGLIKAAEKFDETRGFKFISYAVWWIRQSILQALGDIGKDVRLPMNQVYLVSKYKQLLDEFDKKYQRPPSDLEAAAALNVSEDKITLIRNSINKTVSLDVPLDKEDGTCLSDTLTNSDPAPDTNLTDESLHSDLEKILSDLNTLEKEVICSTFGFNSIKKSPEVLSEQLGLSVERIRQLQNSAIIKLRTNSNLELLSQYLG